MQISVQNRQDITIADAPVGTVIVFPDGSKEQIMYSTTDKVDGEEYYLTQVNAQNIKKDGTLGKLSAWMKFRHYTPLTKRNEIHFDVPAPTDRETDHPEFDNENCF